MTQATFRARLTALLDEFLEQGGDIWWLNRELSVAGMTAIEEMRCDLADLDCDAHPDATFDNPFE